MKYNAFPPSIKIQRNNGNKMNNNYLIKLSKNSLAAKKGFPGNKFPLNSLHSQMKRILDQANNVERDGSIIATPP